MKKIFVITRGLGAIALAAILFSTCVKDKITRTYTISTPIYEALTSFRKSIKSLAPTSISAMGKIAVSGKYLFVSDVATGIHVIDNSDPSTPKNVAFINIPGNQDMAISGNTLYADAYSDLVTFDISDPANAVAKNFGANVFPDNTAYYAYNGSTNPDSINVIIGWVTKDTTVAYDPQSGNNYNFPGCSICPILYTASSSNGNGATPQSGSLSRFAVLNNYLYTVSNSSLTAFDITAPLAPAMKNTFTVDWHVETIYPFKGNLFVGTNNGVYMYNAQSSPSMPTSLGEFTHARGCDPVIADNNYAYVTINDSSACLGFNNQLQIVSVKDLNNTSVVQTYQLVHPDGLSKDGNTLFICDGTGGLKIYDATNVANLQLIKQITGANVYDIITQNGLAIVAAKDGIYQYDYSNLGNIHLLSKL